MTAQHSDSSALQQRLDFIGIDEAARSRLRTLDATIAASIGPALDTFYGKVRATPNVSHFFSNEGHIQSAKHRQKGHWGLIASGQFDASYVSGVSAVGKAHARLGLEPRWYIGGYALILEQLVHAIMRDHWPSLLGRSKADELAATVSVAVKAALLDMDYAISVYLDELAEARRVAQAEKERVEAQQRSAMALLAEALDLLAKGNLQNRLGNDLPGEYAAMADNFNRAVESLRQAVANVGATSRSIVAGVEGIAGAADNLARRTETQAASLEESSAALHELTENVKLTADSASRASSVVKETQAEAHRTEGVVADAVGAMQKIQGSSASIAEIIGVIDEIAFQTNLLALNAGVEAARAGDAGRGFAVVAQEVRGLAQRSASSAREIKELIRTSTEHVESGVSLVGAAGSAISNMVGRIKEINGLMVSIAAAAAEQSQGISQVSIAVTEMDQITQQNAAMVEETSAEAQHLKEEAAELGQRLAGFQIGGTGEDAGARQARALRSAAQAAVPRTPARPAPVRKAAAAGGAAGRSPTTQNEGWEEF